MSKPRVLLIGWDAADWKLIRPLLQAGEMPHLARLLREGVSGNIATLYPVLSPMLWTSIATGKRAYQHGIHGFIEPLPDGSGVRPISILSRRTKALWNILNQNGYRSLVVGWWPSHPAEPINGVMVSNHFSLPSGMPGKMLPLPVGTIHPPSLARTLSDLRINPMELTGEFLRPFVPDYERINQKEDKRLHMLGKIIAETMSVHAVGTELLETQEWDFAALYYSGLDHFGHGFMRYHPPRLSGVSEVDFAVYQTVINNAYRYHDAMLGALLELVDEQTTVILMSDHGFHPDAQRPEYIPAEPAGPAIEHRHFGILGLRGPGLRRNETIYGASLLDICPTVLSLFGLPPGRDMEGKVLHSIFQHAPKLEPIKSWDAVPGDAGLHPPETQLDFSASAAAFQQLVELGYIAPPTDRIQETVAEGVRELEYNLARSYRDGNHCATAAALAEKLWTRWPAEHRFGILLIDCLTALQQTERRRSAVETLAHRVEQHQRQAQSEIAQPESQQAVPSEEQTEDRRTQLAERRRWELAQGAPLLLEWLRLSQALLEGRRTEARERLSQFLPMASNHPNWTPRIVNALMELDDVERAEALLNQILFADTENPVAHAQLAELHFRAGRFDRAIAAATESLSLLYFQPALHALLGRALLEQHRFAEAESELLVAVAQSPRHLIAHETLAVLYRRHLSRPEAAFAHEGRAQSLRNELTERQRNGGQDSAAPFNTIPSAPYITWKESARGIIPPPFPTPVRREQIITVVSGLPRSGTSLMMQMLAAAGRAVLSDDQRRPDADNALGYYEFAPVLSLAQDASWLPQARGKVVKVVAQLLPHLPRHEHYEIVFMERNLEAVIASQQAMLTRQGRHGARLEAQQLAETYQRQLTLLRQQMNQRPEIRWWALNYDELLADVGVAVRGLAEFLGAPFDRDRAIAAVRPELRRH